MLKSWMAGVGLLAIAGVAVAAGWYVFVREDAELATEAPDIPADIVGASTTPTDSVSATVAPVGSANAATLTYQIVSDLSEAAYFADEELASVGLPSTAKGATNDITGTFHLTGYGTALDASQTSAFTVDLTTLTSDEDRRDNRVQQALETGEFPTATFTIAAVSGFDPAIAEGTEQNLVMTGTLDLHGVQREVAWDVKAKREGNGISALATISFLYADFEITPPNIGGFVTVEDDVTLQVQLVAELVS